MQISVETTSGLERRMTIGLPAEKIDSEVEKRLKDTAGRVRIDGFRPGKVPVSVVRQRYGKGIRQEVVSDVMRSSFVEAVTQEKMNPAGMPAVEPTKNKKGEDFEFVATFEIYPEVAIAGFDGFTFDRETVEITDADVDKMLDSLQKQRTTYEAVERAAANDDQVTIDFVGKVDGEEFDGGKAEGSKVVLGSGSMIPGFEEGIVGMSAGEEKTIDVNFPEDYQAENLAGKAAQFDIKVTEVAAGNAPEIDKEFIESFHSKAEDVDGFKTDVRQNMEREATTQLKSKLKNSVVDQLLEANAIDVPSALVKDEIHRLKHQAVQQFGGGANLDPDTLPDDMFKDQGERRVKVGLLMNEVIKQHEIKADPQAVRGYIEEMAAVYQDPQVVIDYYYNNQEQLSQVEAVVVEEAVVEKVLSESQVTDKTVSYEDAMRREQQAG